jgi:hypothetical protein
LPREVIQQPTRETIEGRAGHKTANQTKQSHALSYHLLEHFLLSGVHAKYFIKVKRLGSFLGCITTCYIHFSLDGLLQHGWVDDDEGEYSLLAQIKTIKHTPKRFFLPILVRNVIISALDTHIAQ